MVDYLHQEEQFGGYETANRNSEIIQGFYDETAKLLNCKSSNIAFATSSTDAYAKALSSIPFKEEDCIITTDDDYISNQIAFISLQKRLNIKVIRIKKNQDNELDLEDLEDLIRKHQPKLIAVTHIPTNSGLIQNVEGVGKICRQHNILYLVDACQSVGQMVVDVQKIECDFLTATGRKFMRGPRGTGFLYVSDRVLELGLVPLLLDLNGADWTEFDNYKIFKTAKRFEYWEISYSSLLGFTEAVRYANQIGLNNIEEYNKKLAATLRTHLENKGFRILDKGNNLSSIVTFCSKDGEIDSIQNILKENNIYFSVSYKGGALIDFSHKNIDKAVRLSPHYFNTVEEIEKVSQLLSN
ncbi:cysteine desulfurase/selenocysteine lyase [Chryseobacterium sp. H1D6B]|nr:cysteine desulfurase/selenocysteine lyase [Chryseobacterium sp. H1D6B]